MKICIKEQDIPIIAKTYSAFIIGGCEPDILCEKPDYNMYLENETIIIEGRGVKESISWISVKDASIRINKELQKRYIHFLYGEKREVLEAYITDEKIDPWIFAGLYTCFLHRKNDRRKAFIESLTILSLGKGSLSNYSARIRSEHSCLHRIIQAIDRLFEKNILEKIFFKELLITCRGTSNNIYLVKIHKLSRGYIVDFPKIINTYIDPKASSHPLEASLICGLDEGILSKAETKRKNIILFYDEKCLYSNDPVRNIVFLEKIIS
ncbi:MAG: hypothetical protein J7J82_03245 [Staphylothermus sp.]|nr:hypothetical protein [Staphylothermus sp.]